MELTLKQRRGCVLWSIFALLFAISGMIILITDPVTNIALYLTRLREGSTAHEMWKQLPVELTIKAYIFNITNAERFLSGKDKKLKVEEVGPYIFKESRGNYNITFNDNGTMSFVPNTTIRAVPGKSIGDPKVDRVTIANLPLLGVYSAISNGSRWKQHAVNTFMWSIKAKPIINLTVDEFLWGYQDELMRLLAGYFPAWVEYQKFGIFDVVYNVKKSVVTIDVNATSDKLYSIQYWDGEAGIRDWGFNNMTSSLPCNTIQGSYEGYIFPPNLKVGSKLDIFKKTFCRKLHLYYNKTVVMDSGLKAFLYKLRENSYSCTNPENECFCPKDGPCYPDGLSSVSPCYHDLPVSISFPHFYGGDKSLLEHVEGLNPQEEKHSSSIYFQPDLGVPLKLTTKTQLNYMMGNIKYVHHVSRFSNTVIPILWMDAVIDEIPWDIEFKILLGFKYMPIVQTAFSWILIVSGLTFFVYKSISFLLIDIDLSKKRHSMNYMQIAMSDTFKK